MMPNGAGGGPPPFQRLPQPGLLQQQLQQQQQMMLMMQRPQRFAQQAAVFNSQPINRVIAPRQAFVPVQPIQGGFAPARGITPPVYTAQMAQDYRLKASQIQKQQQKLLVDQQKQMEQAMKQRQFQEQQKRLKEFSTIGGRKMDADRLIDSIMGNTGSGRPQPNKARVVPGSQNSRPTQEDDNFGDFMTGPAEGLVAPPASGLTAAPAADLTAAPGADLTAAETTIDGASQGQGHDAAQVHDAAVKAPVITQPEPVPEPDIKQEKKGQNLMAMMMQCSDLTAPQKAKGFVKPSMKEIQPAKKSTVTYQESKQARRWDAATDSLTELFTVPAPPPPVHIQQNESTPSSQVPPNQIPPTSQPVTSQAPPTIQAPPKMPKWVTGEAPVPDVYKLVLEAATVDGKISTEHLYPILLRSNLPREGLGFLWNLCNKETPGQLSKPELFMLLAMISVAQNNMNCTSLEVLSRCPQAPIPNLGQQAAQPQQPTNQPSNLGQQAPVPHQPTNQQSALQPQGGQGTPATSAHAGAVPATGVTPTPQITEADNDFADFQTASLPQASGPSHSVSFGDFTMASQNASASTQNTTTPISSPPKLLGQEDKYSAFQDVSAEQEKEEDIDEYFKSGVPPSIPVTDPTEPFKRNPKYPAELSKQKLETDFPVSPGDMEIRTKIKSEPVMPDFESFGAFAGSHSESSSSQSQGWTSNSSNSGFTTGSSNTDDFADFAIAESHDDDFADFQQATDSAASAAPDKTDKLSALKALVQNKTLFTDKPQMAPDSLNANPSMENPQPTSEQQDEDDWSTFSSANTEQDKSKSGDVYDALKNVEPVVDATPQMDWFSAGHTPATSVDTAPSTDSDWAAFSDNNVAQGTSVTDNSRVSSGLEAGVNTKQTSEKRESNIQVDKSKSDKIFAKNLNPGRSTFASFGASAFDMAPPDLPDMRDEEEDEFDEFGTFQGGHGTNTDSEGISSLAAGIDDFADFSIASSITTNKPVAKLTSQQTLVSSLAPSKDTSDTVSMSSMEFSGWKSQSDPSPVTEDTQSTRSLELKPPPKEDSPSGGDSQSVSSLEFTAADRKSITPQDERSVASLELKMAAETASVELPTEKLQEQDNKMTESFGEFSSAAVTSPDDNSTSTKNWNMAVKQDEPTVKPRDVSELMTQGDLITVGDRYSGLIKEPQDTDKHTYYWQRCLEKAKKLLIIAVDSLQTSSQSDVCKEIVNSEKGAKFMKGIIEVYRVTSRIKQAMKSFSISNQKLVPLTQEIQETWSSLSVFLNNTHLMPEKEALDFSKAVLKSTDNYTRHKSCGICLLDVDCKHCSANIDNGHKLTYGGRQYHASCANFWVNCVDSTLPALAIPELL